MQTPHDDSSRWLVTLFASLFAGGVGWLVKHLAGRRSEFVQLGLQRAQAAEIRAKIRREDAGAEFEHMRALAQEARADVQRLRQERDGAESRERMLELQLEREVGWRKANGWPQPPEER